MEHPAAHPIVILKDVTYADLRTMVDFMYCGEVNVTEEQLPQVSKLSIYLTSFSRQVRLCATTRIKSN